MSQVTVTEIIAVVFDFDDTLMPDTTSKLLRVHGIKPDDFWPKSDELIRQGYDQPTAYLKLLLDNVGEGRPLGKLTNDDLAKFGAGLDGDFFSGLPGFFDNVRTQVQRFKNINVEFYIISGGLQAIMEGSAIVKKYFAGAYGCHLGTEPGTNVVTHIKRSITFTEKTRYLFEINKGIKQSDSEANPFLVNRDVKHEDRRIPLKNIFYVGDGLTDIPCFSTVKHFGGEAFGVFDPTNPEKTKRASSSFWSLSVSSACINRGTRRAMNWEHFCERGSSIARQLSKSSAIFPAGQASVPPVSPLTAPRSSPQLAF